MITLTGPERMLKLIFYFAVGAMIGGGLVAILDGCGKKAESQTIATTFYFTWPGDDGMVGTASGYEIRLSTSPGGADTTAWWNAAPIRRTVPPPYPKVAGTADSVAVDGLANQTTYYAIMKACDEVPNWSGFSNVAVKTTTDIIRPDPPRNLRGTP